MKLSIDLFYYIYILLSINYTRNDLKIILITIDLIEHTFLLDAYLYSKINEHEVKKFKNCLCENTYYIKKIRSVKYG